MILGHQSQRMEPRPPTTLWQWVQSVKASCFGLHDQSTMLLVMDCNAMVCVESGVHKHTFAFVAKGLCEIMRAETVECNLSVHDLAPMCACVCA